ncbi:DUF2167 domain-containing protein [Mesorhizobium sp. M0340]|uniref:DUF2167 domain-containing protein n=1 Tax=unclassified Mesorhizobium TaxID=325217 RepID=UPI00333829BB
MAAESSTGEPHLFLRRQPVSWFAAAGHWGIELRWEKIGYVDDSDAASIDYNELLRNMQSDTLSGNDQRGKGRLRAHYADRLGVAAGL